MYPYLLDLGTRDLPLLGPTRLALPTYGALFAAGVLLAWWWFARRVGTLDLPHEKVWGTAFYSLLAGILGAKLALVLVEWRYYLERPLEIVGTVRSAGVLIGGVAIGSFTGWLYCRKEGISFWVIADAAAAPIALAQSVGRLGCLAAGCCYGVRAAAGGFGLTFHDPDSMVPAEFLGVPLFPIQLVQMANDLALAALLTWLWRLKPRPEGTVFWWYVLLYGATRAFLELWRGDEIRGLWFGGRISTSQIFGLLAVAVAAVALARGRLRARSAVPA